MDIEVFISVPVTVAAVTVFIYKALPLLSDRVSTRGRQLARAKQD